MPTATVKVRYVNPPKPGKKMGSIKTYDDEYFNVWPDKLDRFAKDQTYTINYTEEGGFKSFKNFADEPAAPRRNGAVKASSGGGDSKAEEMFVMGFLNRCYGGGSVMPSKTQLVAEGRMLRSAWQEIWEEVTVTRGSEVVPDVPSDEIPF